MSDQRHRGRARTRREFAPPPNNNNILNPQIQEPILLAIDSHLRVVQSSVAPMTFDGQRAVKTVTAIVTVEVPADDDLETVVWRFNESSRGDQSSGGNFRTVLVTPLGNSSTNSAAPPETTEGPHMDSWDKAVIHLESIRASEKFSELPSHAIHTRLSREDAHEGRGLGQHYTGIGKTFQRLLANWPPINKSHDIFEWYLAHMQRDFDDKIPELLKLLSTAGHDISSYGPNNIARRLQKALDFIANARRTYKVGLEDVFIKFFPQSNLILGETPGSTIEPQHLTPKWRVTAKDQMRLRFDIALDNLVSRHPKTKEWIYTALKAVVLAECGELFRLKFPQDHDILGLTSNNKALGKEKFGRLLSSCYEAGFGNRPALETFAHAMNSVIDEILNSPWLQINWISKESVLGVFNRWADQGLQPFVTECCKELAGGDLNMSLLVKSEADEWKSRMLRRIGELRVELLFDYVQAWPASRGAFTDLQGTFTDRTESRNYLKDRFISAIDRRLLHTGASTRDVLDFFTRVCNAFAYLEPAGILLSFVIAPITRYLIKRTDTMSIIVSSMLTEDISDEEALKAKDISKEIAKEMIKPSLMKQITHQQDSDLDFDNMQYTPQPVDASNDYRQSAKAGALVHLLNLRENRGRSYINALKNKLADLMLKEPSSDHDRAELVCELFEAKFGREEIQAIEVMIHDVRKSASLSRAIRRDPAYQAATEASSNTQVTVTPLSGQFWPELHSGEASVPRDIQPHLNAIEVEYEKRNPMQRLEYLNVLGSGHVKLTFEDGRLFEERVPAYVATVIDAFTAPGALSLIINDVMARTKLSEELVEGALVYLIGKRVIHRMDTGAYAVLENAGDAAAAGIAATQEAPSAAQSAEDQLEKNAQLYQAFMLGMLTNKGEMPAGQAVFVLNETLPGGFPFGVADLKAVLRPLVDEGKLFIQGDIIGVKKT